MRKFLSCLLAAALIASLCGTIALAEGETVKRVLFVNAAAANQKPVVAETAATPEYRVYTVNVDGKIEELKILKAPGYNPTPGYLPDPWFGLFDVTVNKDGYVEKTRAVIDEEIVQGFSINAPTGNKIALGAKGTEYTFAASARVFIGSKDLAVDKPEIKPSEIQADYDGAYWLVLNGKGEIETMYISVTPNLGKTNKPLTDNIAKFDAAWGPEASDGKKIEYNYFKPEAKDGEKYPLVVWFHGSGCGQYQEQSLYDYNAIANFASDDYQAAFEAGGAYVMTPRANETWVGVENGMAKWSSGGASDATYNPLVSAFYAALDDFIAKNPSIDTDRIYVGGFSNGGTMTWLTIRERPDFFAAAFPNCPQDSAVPSPTELDTLSKFSALPIWQAHGIADPVVPSAATTKIIPFFTVEAARTGTDSRFSLWKEHFVDPDGNQIPIDHLAWAATLNNMLMNDGTPYIDKDGVPVKSTLIEWFNGQTRSANLARAAKAETTREAAFTDVNAGDWYYNYVSLLTESGAVNGMGDGKFSPGGTTTIGQAVKLVLLAAGYDEQLPADGDSHWAGGYITAAVNDGLLDRDWIEGDFDAPVDRLTVARLIAKALKLETTLTDSPFNDTDDAAALALYEAGVVSGDDLGNYNPDGNLKRSELCKLIAILNFLP